MYVLSLKEVLLAGERATSWLKGPGGLMIWMPSVTDGLEAPQVRHQVCF